MSAHDISNRWPHIKPYLRIESSGRIDDDFHYWWSIEETLSPAEQAAANEEWADFYEFRLAQRAEELAGDKHKRGLVEEWTESMAYCLRRSAAYARGEDPGETIPVWVRRPDLHAAKQARVAAIIAELGAERQLAGVR